MLATRLNLDSDSCSLYRELGSLSLRSLLHQNIRPQKTFRDKVYTNNMKVLALARLELFLRTRSLSDIAIDPAWLHLKNNFKVKGANKIRSIHNLDFNATHMERTIDVSAAAVRSARNGPLVLWLTRQVDMFE